MEMPGTRPCDCEHEYGDHEIAGGSCRLCPCSTYRPIPRSELRKRQFDAAREESAAKADAASKSERKSQQFPTATTGSHRFWVQQETNIQEHISAVTPFGIAVGDHPVVDNGNGGGNQRYMTYKSERGAENGLARARLEIPDARIVTHSYGG